MPLSKPKTIPAKKDPASGIKSAEEAQNLLATVQDLQFEVMELQKRILPEIRAKVEQSGQQTKDFITKIAREHFDSRHERILASIYEFFCSEPVWETRFIPGVQPVKDEVENLYRQGFRYLCSTMDPATKISGTLYHRPVMPKTFDEFKAIYGKAMKAKDSEPKTLKNREEYYASQAGKSIEKMKKAESAKVPAIKKLAKK